jgi:hypothetical protein
VRKFILALLLLLASRHGVYAADEVYVRMSGIPNYMADAGQSCSLTAVVRFPNGTSSYTEELTWSSSNTEVARIDDSGNLFSVGVGTTVISVSADLHGCIDRSELTVVRNRRYIDVGAETWERMTSFNDSIKDRGAQLYFWDFNPAWAASPAFTSEFRRLYGSDGRLLTNIGEENAAEFYSLERAPVSLAQIKPSAGILMTTNEDQIALLPLKFTFNLEWSEVENILERTSVSSVSEADVVDLFKKIRLVFTGDGRRTATVIDWKGDRGVGAASALSSEALKFNSGNNLALQIEALLCDAPNPGVRSADIIGGRLVVADNALNGRIAGEMLLAAASSQDDWTDEDDEDSGGGGCDAGFVPAMAAIAAAFAAGLATRRKKNK